MKIERLISIIMMLLDKKRISALEFAEAFGVSQRTIYRDIETISMSGIPIESVPGVGGGFEILEQYKIDKNVFSSADLSTILMGLSNLPAIVHGDELINALTKVKSLIPAERSKEVVLKANQLSIDLSPWLGNHNLQLQLDVIKTALYESRLIRFDYSDRYGNKSLRSVEPYQLVLKNGQWYVQGYCLSRRDYRLFKLIRISNISLLKEAFVPREYEKPMLDFSTEITKLQKPIQIRIHQSIVDRVLEFCSFENFSQDGPEHYRVDFPFVENDFYYTILFGFGEQCECLGPLHVRQALIRKIQNVGAIYGD